MTDPQDKLSKVEHVKIESRGLFGTIAEEFTDKELSHFNDTNLQLLKHHGTYQQDNRDLRTERRRAGLDKAWSMMLRTKTPGGLMTAEQYILCDDLATKYGQDDLRITSRQGFQFHGVLKGNLRSLIHDLNRFQQITTLGACGDVVRNVTGCSVADIDPQFAGFGVDLFALARKISDRFLPKSSAYFDLWLNDEKVEIRDGAAYFKDKELANANEEPIYKKQYLPRKFKIGVSADLDNAADIYTNDVGVIAVTEDGRLSGWEILAGGGLGHSHSKEFTYPRLASHIAFVATEDELLKIVQAVIEVQRDFGDRTDRHKARLKYTIDRMGLEPFRAKVAEYAGMKELPAPSGRKPVVQPHYLGWHTQHQPGMNYLGVWVENGRIRDFEKWKYKTGLRAIVEKYKPSVRLTAHHRVILANIADADKAGVEALLKQYGIPTSDIEPLRRMEMACPALPLCGLALAEAERELPNIIASLLELGHADDEVTIRMTGCPNSCARPETAEIGIIGRGPNKFNLYAGADRIGSRMNELVAESVPVGDVAPKLSTLLKAWKAERAGADTSFGDWARAKGADALKTMLA